MGFESVCTAAEIAAPTPMRALSLRAPFAVIVVEFLILFTASVDAQPRDAARLSTEFCVGCHGPNLNGGPAPSLLEGCDLLAGSVEIEHAKVGGQGRAAEEQGGQRRYA